MEHNYRHLTRGAILREDYPYISGESGVPYTCSEDDKPKIFTTDQENPTSFSNRYEPITPVIGGGGSYFKEDFLNALRH